MRKIITISVLLLAIVLAAGAEQVREKAPCTMTLEQVQKMIKEKGLSWKAGETSVSNLSPEQKRNLFNLLPENEEFMKAAPAAPPKSVTDEYPERFDWRDYDGVTPSRNQGACGSCWDFGATSAWEAILAVYDNEHFDLSEQQVLDCTTGNGCNGGTCSKAYGVFEDPGSVLESDIPYKAVDNDECTQDQYEKVAVLDAHSPVGHSVEQLKTALLIGPVCAGIRVFDDFFYYTEGCYEAESASYTDHAILILGWDDTMCDGEGAWICKNSWGTSWGMNGFFYIKYGSAGIGLGASRPIYTPVLAANLFPADTVMVDSVTGNGNGRIDEGETVEYWGRFLNIGSDATDVRIHLDTEVPGITIGNSMVSLGDMNHLQPANNQDNPFTIAVADTFTGRFVTFTIDVTTNEGYAGSREYRMLVGRPSLLLIDDDGGDDVETWYEDDIDAVTSLSYEKWDISQMDQQITGSDLCLYDNIVWVTGLNEDPIDTDSIIDTTAVKEFLDNGGHLFLSGQNIGEKYEGTAFFNQYLKSEHVKDATGMYFLEGIEDDPLGDGLFLLTSGSGGANNCTSPSAELPVNGSVASITYYGSEYNAAIRYSDDYTLVYFFSSFESITDKDDRRLLLKRIFDYMGIQTGVDKSDGNNGAPEPEGKISLSIAPNPFNPITQLAFTVKTLNGRETANVELSLYDILGRKVKTLIHSPKAAGRYTVTWNGTDETSRQVSSGIYFGRLVIDNKVVTEKLVLLK